MSFSIQFQVSKLQEAKVAHQTAVEKDKPGLAGKLNLTDDTLVQMAQSITIFVRSNLDMHLSDTPFTIGQPIRRPRLLERVYKPIRTLHWCRVLQSSIAESIRDRV